MRYYCISVLSVLATGLLGGLAKSLSPPWDDIHIKHSWNAVPNNWVSLGRPPSGTTVDLYIALKPHRENALINALYETLKLVNSWLEHHSISSSSVSMTHGGNTLKLKGMSTGTLRGARPLSAHVGYSLPRALHWHVLTVVPTTSFVSPRTQWQTPRHRSSGETVGLVKSASGEPATTLSGREVVNYVTPPFLRWLYDTVAYTPNAMGENVLGVVGFLGDHPSPADLWAFMHKYCEADDATYRVVEINGGGYDPIHPSEEANMDIQYAEAMAYPTPHIFYSTGQGPEGTDDWLITWLEYILDPARGNIPQTISISYSSEERYASREYAFYVCDMFARLGALGVSVLVSSGDEGIGKGTCVNTDGIVRFLPRFPGTCPYVTVVGGTTDCEPEVAAVFSGGGFSDHFERPPYQRQAVPTFLEDLGSRYQGLYNASSRGIPDVAAQAVNFRIFFNGQEKMESGTSLAAPVVAGIISLLNDWLISTGQDPLGFLNPWLYGRGRAALNDITEGSNPGCGTDGFSAIVGWDPVTGLGTPSFRKMLEQLF
ncbi:subtilisin-like protein [Lactarius akahatsu]|uniref:tripeptidyl-peptidase II n=1 Tax=Lactarius akahatsu TaxID=416441 RepID=A0AAD4L9N4_9AGAM|nr:subtilisin-like protein [Lactarius akahatsu]